MRSIYTLAAAALLTMSAAVATAQDYPLDAAARIRENADDRARVSTENEQSRLSLSADPAAHVSSNPNAARLDANARAAANLPQANVNGNVVAGGAAQVADPNRWRYVQRNNQWWYYTPNNTWMYYNNNAWTNYDAATYVRPRYQTGYRGYNNYQYNQYNNRRYNYNPGVRARANVNGNINPGGPINNVLPGAGVGAGVGAGLGVRGR